MLPITFDQKGLIDFEYRVEHPFVPLVHSHSFYEVYYFHQGKCNYLIGDKIYMLSPGDLILMNGMTIHGAKVDPSVPYIRTIIHFDPTFLRPFMETMHAINFLQPFQDLKSYRISLGDKEKDEVEHQLSKMSVLQQRKDSISINRMQLAFVDLLYIIYAQCINPMRNRLDNNSEKERTVQSIISFIEDNYVKDLHLKMMEEHLHFSKSYLAKLFKEVTGITIFDFIYRRRINQARILLLTNPKRSITEVCFESGFKHLAHFSRLFKAHIGITPEQYKKQIRQNLMNPF